MLKSSGGGNVLPSCHIIIGAERELLCYAGVQVVTVTRTLTSVRCLVSRRVAMEQRASTPTARTSASAPAATPAQTAKRTRTTAPRVEHNNQCLICSGFVVGSVTARTLDVSLGQLPIGSLSSG